VIDNALVIAGIVAEIAVLCLLLGRGAQRTLPVFCSYMAWAILTDVVNLIVLTNFRGSYGTIYSREVIADAFFQLAVLVELAWSVLRPSRQILPKGAIFVVAGLVVLAGLVLWPLAGMTIPPNLSRWGEIYVHFQQTTAILRVVCFLVMAGFSQVLSIGWKDRELQIATGLGFFSIVSLIGAVLHSHQEIATHAYHWLDDVVAASYICTLTYWIFSFATKEQERKEFSPQMQQLLLLMGGGARVGRIGLGDLPSERRRNKD
jgi:hypothetical protein